jgi:preprotein translocase subunit SecA
MVFLNKIIGDSNRRYLKKLQPVIDQINGLEKAFEGLSGDKLKDKTLQFKNLLVKKGEFRGGQDDEDGLARQKLDGILPEAFALVREAAKRTLNQRHFDVQLFGGIALHQGKITEMKTGEGKTLAATLPVYLNALLGKGVHVVTVNDYLARRDTVWMGQIYHFLGLTVGCINHDSSFLYDPTFVSDTKDRGLKEETDTKDGKYRAKLDETRDALGSFKVMHEYLRPCSRSDAYGADITYGTNNEFGFDYLRDNMAYSKEQLVQRGHFFAIIDEVDSILIDEARTPLIISAPDTESTELYKIFAQIVPQLKAGEHYEIDEKHKAVIINEAGIERVEKLLGVKDIYTEKGIKYVHHLEQALRAYAIFKKDKDYVVKNGEVIIIDEFTGRLMPGRRWSDGLHQAVEAKEGVTIQKESRTLASISFQNYFKMYKKLAGMTGTALTSAEEFKKVYDLDVVVVPTNKPLIRKDYPDLVYQTEAGKFRAVVEEIKERHKKGQPILVGTVSIDKNETLSAFLKKEGIPHQLLNAKHHEKEGEIIAQAGRLKAVTVATNMAGRGVDIVLGGNPPNPTEAQKVKELGGLFVLGTERHEARRIDNQLRGRSGRQGDPGESRFFVSLEDDLMRIFGSERLKNMMGTFGVPEDQPIENKMVSRAIESAQAKIEGINFDLRKHLLEYDDVMNKQRTRIYQLRKEVLFSDRERLVEIIKGLYEEANGDFLKLEEKAKGADDKDAFWDAQRFILLRSIDMGWLEHLETMDYLRSSVRLRAYGQQDPLVEYKNEGTRLFRDLLSSIKSNFVRFSLSVRKAEPENFGANIEKEAARSRGVGISLAQRKKKIGRNDPCPCGSGKKYKKCCGK